MIPCRYVSKGELAIVYCSATFTPSGSSFTRSSLTSNSSMGHIMHSTFFQFHSFFSLNSCWHRLLARWVSRHPVDGHLLKKIVLFFICSLSYKLFIWSGPIAHFGCPLFKSWLKACGDTITQSHVFDILDTNLPSWAFWILVNSSTAIWGQRAVNKSLIYFFLSLLGSYFQPFCELTPLAVVEDHKQTPKTAGNQV